MSLRQFWANRRALMFSLSLSESLKGVHRTTVLRYRNLLMSGVATPLAFAAAPFLGVLVLSIYVEMVVLLFTMSGLDELAKAFLEAKKSMILHARMERFKRFVTLRLGQDVLLQSFRMLWGATLIICCAGVAAAPHFFPSSEAFFRKVLFGSWYQGLAWTPPRSLA